MRFHGVDLFGRMSLPMYDLGQNAQSIPGAVGACRVPRKFAIRQIRIVLDGSRRFDQIYASPTVTECQFGTPYGGIQRGGEKNVPRVFSFSVIGGLTGTDQVTGFEIGFGPVKISPGERRRVGGSVGWCGIHGIRNIHCGAGRRPDGRAKDLSSRGHDMVFAFGQCRIAFSSGAQDLFHFAPVGQFIHKLVEVAHLSCKRVFDVFDAVSADHAGNEGGVGMEGSLPEKSLESGFFIDQDLEPAVVMAGEPVDDLVQFLPGPALAFHFGDIVGIHGGKGHGGDPCVVLGSAFHDGEISVGAKAKSTGFMA